MTTGARILAVLAAAVLAACGSTDGGDVPGPTPEPTTAASTATATPEPAVTDAPAPGASASSDGAPAAGPTPTACAGFGSLADAQSANPLGMSTLTGAEMRVGRHPCFERFVFQMRGSGDRPGWSVGYRDPLIADPAGFEVDLRGDASLEVVVRVMTVTDYEGRPPEWPPFTGATTIVTSGFASLLEVRYISAFEGVTQFGVGLDEQRPFRVFWLDDPPRLVIDVFTGEQL